MRKKVFQLSSEKCPTKLLGQSLGDISLQNCSNTSYFNSFFTFLVYFFLLHFLHHFLVYVLLHFLIYSLSILSYFYSYFSFLLHFLLHFILYFLLFSNTSYFTSSSKKAPTTKAKLHRHTFQTF